MNELQKQLLCFSVLHNGLHDGLTGVEDDTGKVFCSVCDEEFDSSKEYYSDPRMKEAFERHNTQIKKEKSE